MFSKTHHKTRKSKDSHAKHANRKARKGQRRLGLEALEERTLMATTHLILDFTPDSHAGNFVDTFSVTRVCGGKYSPRWLDFNGDRAVNDKDVSLAANQITARVQSFFSAAASGLDVRVGYVDLFTISNAGTQWINWGKYYANQQVCVMYVGGTNRENPGYLGRAPQAADGTNIEGYGETYSRSMANWMVGQDPNDTGKFTTASFVNGIAQVIAHEFGHMLGLRHNAADAQSSVMNASQPRNPGAARFLNQVVQTDNRCQQNAYSELRVSFAGQRAASFTGKLAGAWSRPADYQNDGVPAAECKETDARATDAVFGQLRLTRDGATELAAAAGSLASTVERLSSKPASRERSADLLFATHLEKSVGHA